ncbi:isomultiflorenol synthase-like [Euphorbia lathyris]|uniref:isomultiflorenol synthase-like n=1 Tax=Euphorbia lathyris TaxID=212925 RepID=UPI0033142E50
MQGNLVALILFKKLYPGHRKKEIEKFISNAVKYLEDVQTSEGGWAEYDPKHDLLDQEFMLRGKWFQRKDVEVVQERALPIGPEEGGFGMSYELMYGRAGF